MEHGRTRLGARQSGIILENCMHALCKKCRVDVLKCAMKRLVATIMLFTPNNPMVEVPSTNLNANLGKVIQKLN